MSKYKIDFESGTWFVFREDYAAGRVVDSYILFTSPSREAAECMQEELMIEQLAAQHECFNNQSCEFDI